MRKNIEVEDQAAVDALLALGNRVAATRKRLKLSAQVVAEAAGISRVTLHRIEKGEPSVSIGAYASVLNALGETIGFADRRSLFAELPSQVSVNQFAGLKRLTWQLRDDTSLTPIEAWNIYRANWRHLDKSLLDSTELKLIAELERKFGRLHGNV